MKKSAKKILMLVLSLVVLIGAFAVFALAEEQPTTATVVYPDGREDVVDVDAVITPRAFELDGTTSLYEGLGNTLYKDDDTEGWIFTVEGQTAALTDLTVTADMAGKRIIASGVQKVTYSYGKSDGSSTTYYTTNDAGTKMSGAKYSVRLRLYADASYTDFKIATDSSGNYGYLDLNGHTLRVKNSIQVYYAKGYVYSSQPGAHLYSEGATMFYNKESGQLVLGTSSVDSPKYLDNITFHCAVICKKIDYDQGLKIVGGRYYQTNASDGFLELGANVNRIRNATFYLAEGSNALFTLDQGFKGSSVVLGTIAKGTEAISNCTFYSPATVPALYSTAGAAVKFENCNFYGITATNSGTDGSVTALDKNDPEAEGGTNTFGDAITYQSVTWVDGTKETYYATSEDAALAYVQTLTKAKNVGPFNIIEGKELFRVFAPVITITVDPETFNAVQTNSAPRTQIFYTITAGTEVEYVTSNNLSSYVTALKHGGCTITLYKDLSFTSTLTWQAEHLTVDTCTQQTYSETMNAKYYFDLNGHTLTSSVSGNLFNLKADLYMYSSQEGGYIDAPNATLIYTNNDEYQVKGITYGVAIVTNGPKEYIKPSADFYIGEPNSTSTSYGKNLTVVCKVMTPATLYGTSATIYGGTFIQSSASTVTYFLQMGRTASNQSHIQNMKNCTFVLTNPQTKPLHLRCGSNRTFTNCTFISPNSNGVELNAYADLATPKKTFTFTNCNFVNVRPFLASAYIAYSGTTSYGTTDQTFFTTDGFTATDGTVKYLAHGTTNVKTITANGVTYALDGELVTSLDNALKITFAGYENCAEYWLKDTSPAKHSADFFRVDVANEKYYGQAYYDYSQITQMKDGKVTAAGEATAPLAYIEEDLAFTYLDVKTSVLYGAGYTSDCGETEEGVFEKFYELFSVPASQYNITMYKNMTVNKGMAFGKLCLFRESNGTNRDYYYSLAQGSMIWDINGTTVTISKDTTGFINLNAANSGGTFNSVFGLEGGDSKYGGGNVTSKLTVKSSKEGGRFINNSSAYLFGVAEGSNPQYSIQGENITVESLGPIYYAQNASNDKKHLEIIGGTYIYNGTAQAISLSGVGDILKDATIVCTTGVSKVLGFDQYRKNGYTIENCTIITAGVEPLFGGNSSLGGNFTGSKATVKDCVLIGVQPGLSLHATSESPVTYEGTNRFDAVDRLNLIYPDGAAGEVTAYSTVVVNGKTYRLVGYYENVAENFVTVENKNLATTERWLVGTSYLHDDSSALLTQQIDGVWYYLANPVWIGKIEGVAIEGEICASSNAGKTVVLTLEGTPELLYYTVTVGGETTYYYGESAISAFLNTVLTQTVNGTYEIKLYNDLTTTAAGQAVIGVSGHSVTYKIDLNGYDWTALNSKATKETYAFVFRKASTYIYSSVPGAVWDVTSAYSILCTDKSGYAYLGEPNSTSTAYGKNLTVKCAAINASDMWSDGFYIYGGTFVQEGKTLRNYFLNNIRVMPHAIKNATFILNNAEYFAYGMRMPTVTNCTIISANGAKLFLDLGVDGTKISDVANPVKDANGTFVNCNFYNIVPNTFEPITITYTDCTFNLSSAIPQAGGYIAFTGGTLASVEALGKTYTFTAKLVSEENVGIVDWGFDLVEYWEVGATATHDNVIVDGVFGYTFTSLKVAVGEQTAEKTLAAMKPGMLGMSLTLQSSIGLNLQISEALENITAVTIGDQTFELVEAEDGKYVYTKFVSPNNATGIVIVKITVGSNVHEIPVSVGSYAKTILGSAKYEAAHNLTYAMVEYVRVMANDASFLSDVAAPAEYAVQTLEAVQSNNNGTILSAIRFNLSGTIAIEIEGENGKDVNLILATTRSEHSTIEGGTAIFAGLYVNEFYGEMTIRVDEEVYKFSLANYLAALQASEEDTTYAESVVKALYNYTYYADAYVESLPKV